MPDQIVQVTEQQMAEAVALRHLIESGALRDRQPGQPFSAPLSFASWQPKSRVFMRPDAARVLGTKGKQYLAGRDALRAFALPDRTDVHVDAVLTDISVRFQNEEYIAGQVFPRVQVTKPSDKYFIYTKQYWLRDEAKVRPPGARAAHAEYGVTTGTYLTENWAIEQQVPDKVRDAADSPLDPDSDAAEYCADRIDLRMEKSVATMVNTAGNWTNSLTLSSTSQWSHASSTPINAWSTARVAVLKACARKPNTLVLGYEVFEQVALHATLLDRLKYTGTQDRPAAVTAQMIAALAQVDRVLVGTAVEDTAYEGATASPSFIWGKYAWLGYVAPSPSRARPSAGYVFTMGRVADSYREEPTSSEWVRVQEEMDEAVISADAGYLWVDAVA